MNEKWDFPPPPKKKAFAIHSSTGTSGKAKRHQLFGPHATKDRRRGYRFKRQEHGHEEC